jgi:hypothetical protein
VVAGSAVTLDGSASSDANSDPLTYAWTLTSKPAGSTAALSSATSAKPTFTADVAGTYVGTLTVNDGKVNSTAAVAAVTSSAVPSTPIETRYCASGYVTWTVGAGSCRAFASQALIGKTVTVTDSISPGRGSATVFCFASNGGTPTGGVWGTPTATNRCTEF